MQEDAAGFLYPVVDASKCKECGLCSKKCPAINLNIVERAPKVYAARSKDFNIIKSSCSGGIFSEIAKYYLENKSGFVCGAAFDERLNVHHILIDDLKDLYKLQGSKYVQSSVYACFPEIKNY